MERSLPGTATKSVVLVCVVALILWFLTLLPGKADMNAIAVIHPYQDGNTWVFDDPAVGLKREPFVSGIPAMIDTLVASIPNATHGFRLLFSAQPFPGYQVELSFIRDEYGGSWYRWEAERMEGWLCPALFKYFDGTARKTICESRASLTRYIRSSK